MSSAQRFKSPEGNRPRELPFGSLLDNNSSTMRKSQADATPVVEPCTKDVYESILSQKDIDYKEELGRLKQGWKARNDQLNQVVSHLEKTRIQEKSSHEAEVSKLQNDVMEMSRKAEAASRDYETKLKAQYDQRMENFLAEQGSSKAERQELVSSSLSCQER